MPNISHHNILFPVGFRDLYFSHTNNPKSSGKKEYKFIKNRKAIVNVEKNEILGVVNSSYRIITNEEALRSAKKCGSVVFPDTKPSEWNIKSAFAPSTKSYCHIDLIHNSAYLEFDYLMSGTRQEVPDKYGPFIRVTNSYNGSRALAFSIGIYRKVCANGMVLPDEIVKFKIHHTKTDKKREEIIFEAHQKKLANTMGTFRNSFRILGDFKVEKSQFLELILLVLSIKFPKKLRSKNSSSKISNREYQEWKCLKRFLEKLIDKYAEELGENAYAVMNVATELASAPPRNLYIRRDNHSFQKLAGEWTITFKEQCQRDTFELSTYISQGLRTLNNEPE